MHNYVIMIILAASCSGGLLYGIVIGSFTAPSTQPNTTFPAVDTNNEIRGFALFEDGFTLQTAATVCNFTSYLQVGGTVRLNNGTLNLTRDFILDTSGQFFNGGRINANNRIVQLPAITTTLLVPSGLVFSNVYLECHSDIMLSGILRFDGNSVLDATGHTIDCGSSGSIVVGPGGSLLIKDATINKIRASSLYCVDNNATVSFERVTWLQDNSYSFTQGSFVVIDSMVVSGTQIFAYTSPAQSVVMPNSTLFFDSGSTFSYAPSLPRKDLIRLADATAALHLKNASLVSTRTGLQISHGILVVEDVCPVISDALVIAEGIFLGSGTISGDVDIKVYPSSGLDVRSGYVVYNNLQ